GIGRAIARALAERGASVVFHGRRSREAAEQAAGGVQGFEDVTRVCMADLADPAQCDRLADEAWTAFPGGLNILVCNAGADTLTGEAGKWSFEQKLDALLAGDLKSTMR